MLYFLTAITGLMLSAAQSLWKTSAVNFPRLTASGMSTVNAAIQVFFSLKFISGALLYVLATLLYVWLFSKYPFYAVQISLVSFSIIFSLIISNVIFKENLQLMNYLGIPLILIGVSLVVWKN